MAFHRLADYEDYNFLKCRFEEIGSKDQYKLRYLVRRVAEAEGVEKIVFVDVKSMADYLAKFYIDNVVVGLDSKNISKKAAGSGSGRDSHRKMEPIIDFGFECEAEVKRDPILDFGFDDIYKEKENSPVDFDGFSDGRIKPILDLGIDLNEGLNDIDKVSDEFLFSKFVDDYTFGYSDLSAFDCDELLFLKGKELESTIAWLVVRNFEGGYLYDSLNLPLYLDDHKRMYVSILEFFSFLNVGSKFKMELLQNLKGACKGVGNKRAPFGWVDEKNEAFVSWVWGYVKKKSDDSDDGMLSQNIEVMVRSSRLRLLSAAYYAWDAGDNTKKWFMRELRGAWSQKKFRDKNKDNGRLNTYIGKSAKKALDEIVVREKTNASDVLERIILAEYARYEK